MIVVVGSIGYRAEEGSAADAAVGMAVDVARVAAAAGGRVELVGKVGDDAAGDRLVLALARDGIGHAALLRDPARGTPLAAPGRDEEPDDTVAEETTAGAPDDGLVPADPDLRPALDAADLSLALRYLSDAAVIVVAEPSNGRAAEVIRDAACFSGATLIVLARRDRDVPHAFGDATVFEAPDTDPEAAFAAVVGRYVAALDGGLPAGQAFEDAVVGAGWQAVDG